MRVIKILNIRMINYQRISYYKMRGLGKIIRFLVEIVVLPKVIQLWLYMSRMYINISLGCNQTRFKFKSFSDKSC